MWFNYILQLGSTHQTYQPIVNVRSTRQLSLFLTNFLILIFHGLEFLCNLLLHIYYLLHFCLQSDYHSTNHPFIVSVNDQWSSGIRLQAKPYLFQILYGFQKSSHHFQLHLHIFSSKSDISTALLTDIDIDSEVEDIISPEYCELELFHFYVF